jgi:hypothetical protein
MQVKKLGYILFVGVIATICILPVAVMPWQTEKAVGNEQLASFPELRKERVLIFGRSSGAMPIPVS